MFKEDCFYFYEFHYSTPTSYETSFHCDLFGELNLEHSNCELCKHYINKNYKKSNIDNKGDNQNKRK